MTLANMGAANIAVLLNQRRERPLVLGGCFLICGASGRLADIAKSYAVDISMISRLT